MLNKNVFSTFGRQYSVNYTDISSSRAMKVKHSHNESISVIILTLDLSRPTYIVSLLAVALDLRVIFHM